MRLNLFSVVFAVSVSLFLSTSAAAARPPTGFDEPGVIDQLMKGKVLQKDLVSTLREIKVQYRSFFKGISVDEYIAKVIDHDNYFKYLSDVKSSKRIKEVVAGKRYEYELEMDVRTPLGNMTLEPVFDQLINKGAAATDETTLTDTVTNYTSDIKGAGYDTRIVPYEDGLLIAHTNYLTLKSATLFGSAKKDFRDGGATKIEELRTELKAKP